MAKHANMRWLGLTGGERLPKGKKAQKRAVKRQDRKINALHGEVTVRKATPEELTSLQRKKKPP